MSQRQDVFQALCAKYTEDLRDFSNALLCGQREAQGGSPQIYMLRILTRRVLAYAAGRRLRFHSAGGGHLRLQRGHTALRILGREFLLCDQG